MVECDPAGIEWIYSPGKVPVPPGSRRTNLVEITWGIYLYRANRGRRPTLTITGHEWNGRQTDMIWVGPSVELVLAKFPFDAIIREACAIAYFWHLRTPPPHIAKRVRRWPGRLVYLPYGATEPLPSSQARAAAAAGEESA